MKKGMIYIHGKGGNVGEADHYKALFPEYDVIGFDYKSETPWDAKEEFIPFYTSFCKEHDMVSMIANSIGAFFSLYAFGDRKIEKAYFISPVVNMEKLILDMMQRANIAEENLKEQGHIETAFGETLSWEYLSWVSFAKVTEYTISSPDELRRELVQVRAQGYAVDMQESVLGLKCVASPIFSIGGRLEGALGVSALAFRLPDVKLPSVVRTVCEQARLLSASLGFNG